MESVSIRAKPGSTGTPVGPKPVSPAWKAKLEDEAMNEQEWLNGTDPKAMLEHQDLRATDRKLRLFAVACCRHLWPLLSDERSRDAVTVAEQLADGLASRASVDAAWIAAEAAGRTLHREGRNGAGDALQALAAMMAAGLFSSYAAYIVLEDPADHVAATAVSDGFFAGEEAGREVACNLLRDLFGNPFRPMTINPSCLTPSVVALGQQIYDRRSFNRLPELAQALEDSGCENAELLAHLYSPGPHVRGCFALDLILGIA